VRDNDSNVRLPEEDLEGERLCGCYGRGSVHGAYRQGGQKLEIGRRKKRRGDVGSVVEQGCGENEMKLTGGGYRL